MFKNSIHVILMSFITLISGIITTLIIPLLLSVEEYGLYKIFTFYLMFLPVLGFGLIEGAYVNYGDKEQKELRNTDLKKIILQFIAIQIIISIILYLVYNHTQLNKVYIYIIWIIIPYNLVLFYNKILTTTLNFKFFSMTNNANRFFLLASLLVLWKIDMLSNVSIMWSYLLIYSVQLLITAMFLKDIFKRKNNEVSSVEEIGIKQNLIIGIPFMLSFYIGQFALGLDRIFIEYFNDIAEYSYYAFSYSMISVFIVLINSVNSLVYPYLVRINKENWPRVYCLLTFIINSMFAILIIALGPLVLVIQKILPQYVDAIPVFYLMIPIILLRSQYVLKHWQYYNLLKKQQSLLFINIFILILVFILNYYVMKSKLDYTYYAMMTLIAFWVWNSINEKRFSRLLKIKVKRNNLFVNSVCMLSLMLFLIDTINIWHITVTLFLIFVVIYFNTIKTLTYSIMNRKNDSVVNVLKRLTLYTDLGLFG